MLLRRFALPAAAAALAIAATAPVVAHLADARPIAPGDTPIERLQAENRQLRLELQAALQLREDVAAGLDRIEQINRSSRDMRTSRRIKAVIRELEDRFDLDQPWSYQPPAPPTPTPPPYRPGGPSTGPGYRRRTRRRRRSSSRRPRRPAIPAPAARSSSSRSRWTTSSSPR